MEGDWSVWPRVWPGVFRQTTVCQAWGRAGVHHGRNLTNLYNPGFAEFAWISEMLTLARLYDSGKTTPGASDPTPDLSPTKSSVICQWQVQDDDSAPRRNSQVVVSRLQSIDKCLSSCIERCQTWCQIVNGHWYRFGHIQGQFTHPTPYMASQNFWQKPSSGPVEYEFYRV